MSGELGGAPVSQQGAGAELPRPARCRVGPVGAACTRERRPHTPAGCRGNGSRPPALGPKPHDSVGPCTPPTPPAVPVPLLEPPVVPASVSVHGPFRGHLGSPQPCCGGSSSWRRASRLGSLVWGRGPSLSWGALHGCLLTLHHPPEMWGVSAPPAGSTWLLLRVLGHKPPVLRGLGRAARRLDDSAGGAPGEGRAQRLSALGSPHTWAFGTVRSRCPWGRDVPSPAVPTSCFQQTC